MATPLDQLAAALVRGHERAKKNLPSASFQVDPIDDAVDELASLVTKVRPHRDRVLEDLALFLRGTLPSGYAMEVRTILREATPWETWERTVHPFVLELRWSPSMENPVLPTRPGSTGILFSCRAFSNPRSRSAATVNPYRPSGSCPRNAMRRWPSRIRWQVAE